MREVQAVREFADEGEGARLERCEQQATLVPGGSRACGEMDQERGGLLKLQRCK